MQEFSLNNSVLVNLDFTLWSGRAKLDASDIPDAAAHMPPSSLCSAGNIKIFDVDHLKQFRNFKTRAEACVASYGCRWQAGWLVDENNIDKLESELGACFDDWTQAVAGFVNEYPARAAAWAQSCGPWESLVKSKQPARDEISQRFKFNWQTVKLTVVSQATGSAGNNTETSIKEFPDKALGSVLESLATLYNDSFNKSTDPSGKAYNALRKIADRAHALGFANPRLARLAPVLVDIANRKNHVLSRLVLSRMGDLQGVEDILQVEAGQGIDSLLSPPEEMPLSPTALDEAKQSLLQEAQKILEQPAPAPVSSMDVLDSLGLF